MSNEEKTATEKFEKLCQKYVYTTAPNTKDDLIEFWSAGISASSENPNDIETLERISNRMQEDARNSRLYEIYPALKEINDDLLNFEDVDALSEDEHASINDWHAFMNTPVEKTKAAIVY